MTATERRQLRLRHHRRRHRRRCSGCGGGHVGPVPGPIDCSGRRTRLAVIAAWAVVREPKIPGRPTKTNARPVLPSRVWDLQKITANRISINLINTIQRTLYFGRITQKQKFRRHQNEKCDPFDGDDGAKFQVKFNFNQMYMMTVLLYTMS